MGDVNAISERDTTTWSFLKHCLQACFSIICLLCWYYLIHIHIFKLSIKHATCNKTLVKFVLKQQLYTIINQNDLLTISAACTLYIQGHCQDFNCLRGVQNPFSEHQPPKKRPTKKTANMMEEGARPPGPPGCALKYVYMCMSKKVCGSCWSVKM